MIITTLSNTIRFRLRWTEGADWNMKSKFLILESAKGMKEKTSSAIDDAHMLVSAAAAQCVGCSLLFTQFRLLHMLVSIIITVKYGT